GQAFEQFDIESDPCHGRIVVDHDGHVHRVAQRLEVGVNFAPGADLIPGTDHQQAVAAELLRPATAINRLGGAHVRAARQHGDTTGRLVEGDLHHGFPFFARHVHELAGAAAGTQAVRPVVDHEINMAAQLVLHDV